MGMFFCTWVGFASCTPYYRRFSVGVHAFRRRTHARDGSLQRRMDGQLVSQEREASRVEAAFLCSFRR